ncbi:MAG: hypothetical protein QXP60_07330 [Nitrososphaerota archaeon]
MDYEDIKKFYSQSIVRKEIVSYCKNRWIAIEGMASEGKRIFIRYWKKENKPLSINNEEDIDKIFKSFFFIKPRTFYGSINIYSKISSKEDLEDSGNIIYASPIWDIDSSPEYWKTTIKIAEIILDSLEKEGIDKSVFLKWSGRGCHIHLHERSFSKEILKKYNPLDIAYSIVEYICRQVKDKFLEIASKIDDKSILKLENKIDIKRVFTAPLSLHRQLDVCCVCFKPNELYNFNLDWTNPNNIKHNQDWKIYEEGEADQLAEKAFKKIGGYYFVKATSEGKIQTIIGNSERKRAPSKKIKIQAKLGRFQVMALLQAARYFILTNDLEKAKSFGLNRAIFYAWAKHRGISKPPSRRKIEIGKEIAQLKQKEETLVYIGNEGAYLSKNGWFKIGEEEQKPIDYDRQIVSKIESVIPYDKAWNAAIKYLKKFPKDALLNQQNFFSEVYKPIRDSFIEEIYSKYTS